MPISQAPFFVWYQKYVLESSGIYPTQNSVGYTRLTDAESAGIRPPNQVANTILAGDTYVYLGTQYKYHT